MSVALAVLSKLGSRATDVVQARCLLVMKTVVTLSFSAVIWQMKKNN